MRAVLRVSFGVMLAAAACTDDPVGKDPATAEALKPWYRQFCKRPCFHDDYLPTFNLPNVTLVDTKGRGVERITKQGVVANGREGLGGDGGHGAEGGEAVEDGGAGGLGGGGFVRGRWGGGRSARRSGSFRRGRK